MKKILFLLLIVILGVSVQSTCGPITQALAQDIPKFSSPSGIIIDGRIDEQEWKLSLHNRGLITNPKTIEFDIYLMHDGRDLFMAIVVHNNDFHDIDQIEIYINDQANPTATAGSGTDFKFMYVNHPSGKNYYDRWIFWNINQTQSKLDSHEDGQGALTFSRPKSNGVLGDYCFEFKIPLNSSDTEDAMLTEGALFFMDISFIDMYSPNQGFSIDVFRYLSLPVDYVLMSDITLTPPPELPAYEISVNPSTQSVSTSKAASFDITVPNFMSISLSGLPRGATYSLRGPYPSGATNLFILTIAVGDETPQGQHTMTIIGSGGGISRSATVQLTVESRPASSTSSSIRAISIRTQFIDGNTKKWTSRLSVKGKSTSPR